MATSRNALTPKMQRHVLELHEQADALLARSRPARGQQAPPMDYGLQAVPPVGETSVAAISAMNWAGWEYSVQCKRRLEIWRLRGGTKVPGSHRVIYDTRPPAVVAWGEILEMGNQYRFLDPRPMTQEVLNKFYSHAIDALRYGMGLDMIGQKIKIRLPSDYHPAHPDWSFEPTPPLPPPYPYERASAWQSNLTGFGPSLSDTLSNAQASSRSEGNKSKHGWLSRTPRKFTK